VKSLTRAWVLLLCFSTCRIGVGGESIGADVQRLQRQVEELRKGQEETLKQLDEIRTLLKAQRSTGEMKPAPPSFLSINVHGEPFRGSAKARVAILEYSDFDCGFCAEFATKIFPQIETNYIKTGKIKFFFRDMPSPEHAFAMFKAKAARCAGEQGKFWEMHDYLFAHQQPMGTGDSEKLAQAVGIDNAKFAACLTSDKYAALVERSLASAEKLRIEGTPAFIIGTLNEDGGFLKAPQVVLGTQTYEFFEKKLDELAIDASKKVPAKP
jgi:protein-disulfide isomerase